MATIVRQHLFPSGRCWEEPGVWTPAQQEICHAEDSTCTCNRGRARLGRGHRGYDRPRCGDGVLPVQYTSNNNDYSSNNNNRWHDDRWDDRAQNINEREARIRARIERGQNDGRLTDREARNLYRQLNTIEAKERTFMADGRLNYREDAELKRNLDALADNVRAQMRDDARRYSYNRQ
jgi:hypothetical protein